MIPSGPRDRRRKRRRYLGRALARASASPGASARLKAAMAANMNEARRIGPLGCVSIAWIWVAGGAADRGIDTVRLSLPQHGGYADALLNLHSSHHRSSMSPEDRYGPRGPIRRPRPSPSRHVSVSASACSSPRQAWERRSFAYCLTAEPRSSVVAPDRKEALGRGVIRRQSTRGSG